MKNCRHASFDDHRGLFMVHGVYPGVEDDGRLPPRQIICSTCHPAEYRNAAREAKEHQRERRHAEREQKREHQRKLREEKNGPRSAKSVIAQLNTLAKLRKSGDITEAEFQALKAQLLGDASNKSEMDGSLPTKRSSRLMAVGEEVIHQKFGRGIVIAGEGHEYFSTRSVRFEEAGIKSVLVIHLRAIQ